MSKVSWERKDKIAIVTIDNPPVNTLNKEIIDGLEKAFAELEKEEGVYAVVLTGNGPKSFVAGADITQFIPLGGDDSRAFVQVGVKVFQKIADFPYPVICAVNGYALGGGLELALACDIRIVEEHAKLGVPEIGLGIIPGYGGTQRLPRLIGSGAAKKLLFSGKPITAEEASRIGLADQLVPLEGSLDAAIEMANTFADNAPMSLRIAKDLVNKGIEMNLSDAINCESDGIKALFESEDKKEGVSAFLEKRKPVFIGK